MRCKLTTWYSFLSWWSWRVVTQHHVNRIDGTEDSVMGLSKDLVLQLMAELAQKLPK